MSGGDAWRPLRRFTTARIALGRTGHALPLSEVLRFQLAHAQARDAVHQPVDFTCLASGLQDLGYAVEYIHSQAADRVTYLQRPDLGRLLDKPSQTRLAELRPTLAGPDVVFVIGDGLSAGAVERQTLPLMTHAHLRLVAAGFQICPTLFLARQARVALADPVGATLNARLTIVLIGERPGLSSPDSLGIYLTFDPLPGRQNAERNCISNIRLAGLGHEQAALKLTGLVRAALHRGLTGVALKEESDDRGLEAPPLSLPVGVCQE
ncbi:MAG: ethanolamine ammonia-lyase subunit EutC [Gammaproteobacteria bacterium]|nr:ethanolamine ammonia-lyase subunit EutC [Gammaproteobacteria bacterium]